LRPFPARLRNCWKQSARTWPRAAALASPLGLADNYVIRAIHGIRMIECPNGDKDPLLIDAEIYLESNWPRQKTPQARP